MSVSCMQECDKVIAAIRGAMHTQSPLSVPLETLAACPLALQQLLAPHLEPAAEEDAAGTCEGRTGPGRDVSGVFAASADHPTTSASRGGVSVSTNVQQAGSAAACTQLPTQPMHLQVHYSHLGPASVPCQTSPSHGAKLLSAVVSHSRSCDPPSNGAPDMPPAALAHDSQYSCEAQMHSCAIPTELSHGLSLISRAVSTPTGALVPADSRGRG
jgi:hypothetical protein